MMINMHLNRPARKNKFKKGTNMVFRFKKLHWSRVCIRQTSQMISVVFAS